MEEQFLHILRNKATREERSLFFTELQHNRFKKEEFRAFEKLWITHNMVYHHSSLAEKKKNFNVYWKTLHPENRFRTLSVLSSVAAVLFVALFVLSIFAPNLWQPAPQAMIFSSPKGNTSKVTLADGSTIWLNSSSSASVLVHGDKKIEVELEGEAFFDVPHNESREFLVKIGKYRIRDLGTQFNVIYEPQNNILSMALFEGAIEFQDGENVVADDLLPGTMLSLNLQTDQIEVSGADINFITAWKEGKFVFANKMLGQISKELERWYDVRFVFKDEKIKEELFSGVISRRTSMEELLKVLTLSANLNYTILNVEEGNSIVSFE